MKRKNNGIRHCTKCQAKLWRNGVTKQGKIRWRCPNCGTCHIKKRPDVKAKNVSVSMSRLLIDTDHQNDLARRRKISRSTVSRELREFISQPLRKPVITGEVYNYIIIDATWLSCGAVAIARTSKHVVAWEFDKQECMSLWIKLFKQIPKPLAIVCDGQKGMLEAIRRVYGEDILIQRCLYHVKQNMLIGTRSSPDHPATWGMRKLCGRLIHIQTLAQVAVFCLEFYSLLSEHKDYLNEHTMEIRPNGVAWPRYTHSKLRTAYLGVDELIRHKQLFTYLLHPELNLPRTTNLVEGGINSRISDLLLSHRGLTLAGQMTLVNEFLYSKTEFFGKK